MKKIYNKSKCYMEIAKWSKCPRCKGFGSVLSDRGNTCHLCKGHGNLWKTESGWTQAKYSKDSQLY